MTRANPWWAQFALFLPIVGFLFFAGSAFPQTNNPILSAPLPVCGLDNRAFDELAGGLELNRVWRGRHENGEGILELSTNKKGAWFLFYRSADNQGRKLICVIARGDKSREWFGRPV